MRHPMCESEPARVTHRSRFTPSALAALAGFAWAGCALAQDLPLPGTGFGPGSGPAAAPSVQNADDPERDPRQLGEDRLRQIRAAQGLLTPEEERAEPEGEALPEPARVRPGGGGVTPDGTFSLDIEGMMDLSAFTELVSETLQINIVEDPMLASQTVVFRAPITIPMDEVLPFLRALLEDKGFALVYDDLGFYRIRPEGNLKPNFEGGALATTRIIPTPMIKPSSLLPIINTHLATAQGQGGVRMTPLDELGILMVTATPSTLQTIDSLVSRIVDENTDLELFPFRLENVSAVYARSRLLQLNGQVGGTGAPSPQAAAAGAPGALSNLDARLFLDQGNTLLFRGSEVEARRVANLIEVVDTVTPLRVKRYVAGSVALEAARAGERLGLGPVQTIDSQSGSGGFNQFSNRQQNVQQGGSFFDVEPAVSGFTVDPETGSIIYYGTESQHATVDKLVEEFKETAVGENIEIKTYKLLYASAEAQEGEEGGGVVDILNELIQEPQLRRTTESPFIPATNRTPSPTGQEAALDELLEDAGVGEGTGTRLIATTENTIIVSDPARNQIIIKAPAKAQEQFEKIIRQLDEKQPQVMIEVKIVALTETDGFNWSADVQFNFGQFTWFSGFGVTGAPDSGNPFDPRTFPTPEVGNGLTTGLIKSDMVPIAIQTLATYGKTRVLSNPQILVNDNQEASLVSEREVPFSASSQGTSTTITSQGGTASAGTNLTVTPRISEGGDITLQFSVELSDFTGPAQGGLQPPAQRDQYDSWVTLPSDSTIVVGGFRLNRQDKQESKVPLLGDIPLLGALFKSYTQDLSDSVIFVFITPKIMRDPSGADLLLITEGPMAEVGLEQDIPVLEPALMPIVGSLGAEERLIRSNAAADFGSENTEIDG